jgi:hypothetical protein
MEGKKERDGRLPQHKGDEMSQHTSQLQEQQQQPELSDRDKVESGLHKYRIHDGFPDQRRSLAVALNIANITAEDIDLLAESVTHQRRRDSDSVAAIMFGILKEPSIAAKRIEDVRKGMKLRGETKKPYPGQALWQKPQPPTEEQWITVDRDRKIVAYRRGDRKSPQDIAAILSISVHVVNDVLAREGIK